MPKEYSHIEPNVQAQNCFAPYRLYLEPNERLTSEILIVGEVVPKAYFNEQVEYCKKVVKRLKAINKMNGDANQVEKESIQESAGYKFSIEF